MSKIISAVPNICCAKDVQFIEFLTQKLQAVPGLVILDVSRDTERNRTVFSFTGTPDVIKEAGYILYEECLEKIDMREHEGTYPRIGAVDVFPFVPLKDVRIAEADALAKEFAEEVAKRFDLPVYLFGESAQFPNRRNIENIREGEYEGLEAKLRDSHWQPDFGDNKFKPTCGATIIGARYPLISFKVSLDTVNQDFTQLIAEAVGNLRHVKAIPGMDAEHGNTQLTISIRNYRKTPMYRALEAVKMEGKRYGVNITQVRTIGLIPEMAFLESALYYMNIHSFHMDRLLERSIQKHLDEQFMLE